MPETLFRLQSVHGKWVADGYTSDLHALPSDLEASTPPQDLGLYLGVEEIGLLCLWSGADRLLHVCVYCKSLVNHVLRTGSRTHTANQAGDLLLHCDWEVIDHPPFNPDFMPSDSRLFGPHNKKLAGKRFVTDADVKQAVTSWLQTLDTDMFYAGVRALVLRRQW